MFTCITFTSVCKHLKKSLKTTMKRINEFFQPVTKKKAVASDEAFQLQQTGSNLPSPSLPSTSRNVEVSIKSCDEYDIGRYLDALPRDDEKLQLLQRPWKPDPSYQFPCTAVGKTKKNLSFQLKWMEQFSWLLYSQEKVGALCKFCVLFSGPEAGRGSQKLGYFVKKPFNNWKNALENFRNHEKSKYHQFAKEKAQNFLIIFEGRSQDVSEALQSNYKKTAEENRRKLQSIIETIVFCGRQNIALRGHSEKELIGITEPSINDGNFRALLRFRAVSGDEFLKEHLESQREDGRGMFTSPSIQNEIIEICCHQIQRKITESMSECYFSILADETQDISRHEQLSICIRYIDCSSGRATICEKIFDFFELKDVTAEGIASSILDRLSYLNLNLNNLVGQGYDGAAVMSGRFGGVRTKISEKYPKAHYVHCASHCLNLVLAHSCEEPQIRNCIGTVKSVVNFFHLSSLRDGILKNIAEQLKTNHENLISLCETRFVEKHSAVSRFVQMYETVVRTLGVLHQMKKDFSTQAWQLLKAIEDDGFIISLQVLNEVFGVTKNLAVALQKRSINLLDALAHAKSVKETIMEMRNETYFKTIFKKAEEAACKELSASRVISRQRHRINVPAETAEIYYRRSVFYPFIDHVLTELDSRFSSHQETVAKIQFLLPQFQTNDIEEDKKKICEAAEKFIGLPASKETKTELVLWRKTISDHLKKIFAGSY